MQSVIIFYVSQALYIVNKLSKIGPSLIYFAFFYNPLKIYKQKLVFTAGYKLISHF